MRINEAEQEKKEEVKKKSIKNQKMYSKDQIKKVEQYKKHMKDVDGAEREKIIEAVTYKNGVVKECIKGIIKNGKVLFNAGIKDGLLRK